MDRDAQAVFGKQRQVACLEKTFEQHDTLPVAGFAQLDRDVQFEQREAVGVAQRPRRAQHPMAVGIGLDHRQHARARRMPARHAKIVAQCAQADGGGNGTGHGLTIGMRDEG
jgi:hypothetical protein